MAKTKVTPKSTAGSPPPPTCLLTLGPGGVLLLALRRGQTLRVAAAGDQRQEFAGSLAVEVWLFHRPLLAQHDMTAGDQVPGRRGRGRGAQRATPWRRTPCAQRPTRGSCCSRNGQPMARGREERRLQSQPMRNQTALLGALGLLAVGGRRLSFCREQPLGWGTASGSAALSPPPDEAFATLGTYS